MLSAAEIAEILQLLEQSSFDELNLEMNGLKLQLRRSGRGSAGAESESGATTRPPAQPMRAVPASPPAPGHTPALAIGPVPVADGAVVAPILGTFYRAPKPGAAPFVEVGTAVAEDTIVGIIEVMKLMNSVRAGRRGVIGEILVADGALVEYGAVLMHVHDVGDGDTT